MAKTLRIFPLPFLLLPLFFVLHGWKEHYYYIHFRDMGILMLTYLSAALVIFGLCLWVFKNKVKAGVYTFILLATYFFFGAIQDFLKSYTFTKEFSRYQYLLPVIFLLLLFSFFWLKKNKKTLARLNYFLSLLMLLFILVDLVLLISLPAEKKQKIAANGFTSQTTACTTCSHPDIYFLLFDEYAASSTLKQSWNYDNSQFDTALTKRGFHLISGSRSNYNFTPFSMASILNMSYLSGIKDVHACSIEDYAMCNDLIRNNGVTGYLMNNGYKIVNYSVFDLEGEPSMVNQSFLPLKARLITEQTLFSRLKKDLGHMLFVGKFRIKWFSDRLVYQNLHNNNLFLRKVKEEAGKKKEKPEFIYAHFYLPHPPYYFDSSGKEVDPQSLRKETAPQYFQYVAYTNRQILQMTDSILKNSASPPVIIIMGDHGFRMSNDSTNPSGFFSNMNAVYLPDKKYSGFYDSLSGVNQFRVLFNTLFHQSIPLLKDSTILLKDQ
ncbi:MAG: sulfatase-like hydrolase/transferase [Chitinophagaceae bacterium]